jgi:hypothetical protein
MSNFYFDLSLKLSQGEVHDFSGQVQKFSGEVQNYLRGGAHLLSKSGLEYNCCSITVINLNAWLHLFHSMLTFSEQW